MAPPPEDRARPQRTHHDRDGSRGGLSLCERRLSRPTTPAANGFARGLAEAAVVLAAVAVPLFFNPTTERVFDPGKLAWSMVLSAIGVVGVTAGLRIGRPVAGRGLLLAAFALLGTVVVGYGLSVAPDVSWWGSYKRGHGLLAYLAHGGLFVAAAWACRGRGARWRLVRAVTLAGAATSAYALLQAAGFDAIVWDDTGPAPSERAFGSMGNPIFLGSFLVMALPLAVAGALSTRAPEERLAQATSRAGYLAATVLMLLALGASASRGPLLGLAAAMGTAAVITLAFKGQRKAALAAVALAAGVGTIVLVAGGRGDDSLGVAGTMWASRTAQERMLLWELMPRLALDEPARALVGFGPDTLSLVATPHLTDELVRLTPHQIYDRTHNILWEWWVTGGLLAVIALTTLHLAAFQVALSVAGLAPRLAWLPCRGLVVAGLAGGALGALAGGVGRPGLAAPGAAFGFLAGVLAFAAVTKRERAATDAGGVTGDKLLAVAIVALLAGHLVEASFGLPNAAGEAMFWLALGLLGAISASPSATADVPAPALEGIADGMALATVAFAPLLLPSPALTAGVPALWLLVPGIWLAGDLLGSSAGASSWARPVARLGMLLVFGAAFALHPLAGAGGATIAFAAVLVVAALAYAVVASGAVTVGRGAVPTPGSRAGSPGAARVVGTMVLAVVLAAALWQVAVVPQVADAHIRASLEAGTRGDTAPEHSPLARMAAVRHAERAAGLWPGTGAYGTYVAAAHRAVLLDPLVAVDLREAAFRRSQASLAGSLAVSPEADTMAKMGQLHRDYGDVLAPGSAQQAAWHDAVDWFDRALELQPNRPDSLVGYAATLERLDEGEGALALFRRSLELDPAGAAARAGVARQLLAKGDVAGAAGEIEIGLASGPPALAEAIDDSLASPVPRVAALQSKLLFLAAMGGGPLAAEVLSDLQRIDPGNPVTSAIAGRLPAPTP